MLWVAGSNGTTLSSFFSKKTLEKRFVNFFTPKGIGLCPLYNPIKCYNTYDSLHYLQELLRNANGANAQGSKKKEKLLNLKLHN